MLNRPNKFNKISGLLFYLGILCVSVIFFAVITLTPVSDTASLMLRKNFEFTFANTKSKENFHINLSEILLRLSFPGINNLSSGSKQSTIHDSVSADNINTDGISDNPERDYVYNPYENIPVADDDSILTIYDLYAYYGSQSGIKIEEATQLESTEIPKDYHKITPLNYSAQKTKVPKLLVSNETSFDIENEDLEGYIKSPYPISSFDPKKNDEPAVLILDTHATESYVKNGTAYYSPPFTGERTTDTNKNVVLVATRLRKKLEEYNIPVIQSTKLHDAVSYRDSYIRSLETMNEYITKYPSIRYIIDIHRDSMIRPDGEKMKPTIKINGSDCAQVMIVVGTDDGGAYHPNWRDNLTFAVYLQQKMNDKYPMLARPINLRNARFNQHTTKGSIILEVGSCGSSFGEALYAADLFGECLAELLLEQN